MVKVLHRAVEFLPQANFLLSDSGDSDSPAGSVPLSWVMYDSGLQVDSPMVEFCEHVVPKS